mgnify:CR=1 FL=1
MLKSQAETDASGAEKYCVTSLDTTDEKYMTDDIMIYGFRITAGMLMWISRMMRYLYLMV